jgi:hypothetical protein
MFIYIYIFIFNRRTINLITTSTTKVCNSRCTLFVCTLCETKEILCLYTASHRSIATTVNNNRQILSKIISINTNQDNLCDCHQPSGYHIFLFTFIIDTSHSSHLRLSSKLYILLCTYVHEPVICCIVCAYIHTLAPLPSTHNV